MAKYTCPGFDASGLAGSTLPIVPVTPIPISALYALMQAEAIALCGDLLADILLCRKHFHLTSKRIKYWGGLVRSTRAAIERWHDSDKARYKDI